MLYNLINKEDYEYDLSLRDVRAVSKRDAVDRVSEKEEFERGDLFWIQTKRIMPRQHNQTDGTSQLQALWGKNKERIPP